MKCINHWICLFLIVDVQKIGEGWYSRVYLTEHRSTRHELVLKAVNNKNMSVEEFLREFHHSLMLGAHQNILTVFPDMVFSLEGQCCMFASEYAPLGKRQFQSYFPYVLTYSSLLFSISTYLYLLFWKKHLEYFFLNWW